MDLDAILAQLDKELEGKDPSKTGVAFNTDVWQRLAGKEVTLENWGALGSEFLPIRWPTYKKRFAATNDWTMTEPYRIGTAREV